MRCGFDRFLPNRTAPQRVNQKPKSAPHITAPYGSQILESAPHHTVRFCKKKKRTAVGCYSVKSLLNYKYYKYSWNNPHHSVRECKECVRSLINTETAFMFRRSCVQTMYATHIHREAGDVHPLGARRSSKFIYYDVIDLLLIVT